MRLASIAGWFLPSGLILKFLLVFVPAFTTLSAVGLWQLLDYDARGEVERLTARVGNQAARAAIALERHGALRRPSLTRDLLAPLTADRAVTCIDLGRPGEDGFAPVFATGVECTHDATGHSIELPVEDGKGTSLIVRFSDAEVAREAQLRRHVLLSMLLLAFVIAIICASIGFRLVVKRRLDNLNGALRRITEGGEREPVDPGGRDELGQIMSAFNAMIGSEARREQALQDSLAAQRASQAELERLNAELEHWIHTSESERRFRDFAASASDWYWEMDAGLRFSYFSDRFSEVTGVVKEKLLGKTRRETGIPNVDQEAWDKHLDALDNHRPFRNFEHPRVLASGETVWLSISGTPVFDRDGVFQGYRGTGSDITERVRTKELIRAKTVSEQLARTKSEFLANMSHEIRTPINGVIGMTEILLKTDLDERQRRFANTVSRSAEGLLRVINDILDFSKIEAGKLDLHSEPFDVRALVEDIGELFAESAHGKGLELACHVPAPMATAFRGDAGRLRQILTNLVGNALKFTREGEIVVRVAATEEAGERTVLRFEVEDSGIGIVEEAKTRVFDSFAQADSSTEREYGGTGLGLAISAQLVELLGGQIGVDSRPGSGSTFWFTVPLVRDAEAAEPAPDSTALAGMRILTVDDNLTNREILTEQLRAWGAEHACAASGAEALDLMRRAAARGRPWQLAVLDMHMPGMDGMRLSRAVRGDPRLAGMRLVMLSSICESLVSGPGAGTTIDAFLTKPVRQSELYRCLVAVSRSSTPPAPAPGEPRDPGVAPAATFTGRVLLAEDNLVNQEVAIELLEPLGVRVDVAEDGRAAVQAWSAVDYDLVFMDCQMPGMNGFDAVREMRRLEADGARRRTPIVALTANAMQGDRERCLDAGMDDYLSKPFSESQLCEMLGKWLPGTPEAPAEALAAPTVQPCRRPVAVAESEIVLDRDVIERFRERERQGRGNVLGRVARTYVEQSTRIVAGLGDAAGAGDVEALGAGAHTLKSSSAQVGAIGLSELCAALEAACRTGQTDGLGERVAAIETLFARVRDALGSECEVAAA